MLFDPGTLAGLRLKNRIVRSATFEKLADEDGFVTDALIRLYEDLAEGGSGLIITGHALVHPSGRTIRQMLCIHSDLYGEGLKRLTDAVHARGGIIAIQLNHGGRQCRPLVLGGAEPMAPSAVYDPATKAMPRAMTDTEIWAMVDAFADAAWRAQAAGFDAVQLHAAHGYLLSSFLSPHTNRRDDYWGGDEERRSHFPEEAVKAVRRAVGDEYPVLMKMNADDQIPGGILPEESGRQAARLVSSGLDAVEVSGGMMESKTRIIRPDILEPSQEAYYRYAGKAWKERLAVPIFLTGGMRTREVMEDVLEKGEADFFGMSRPLIREPNLPLVLQEGKGRAECVSCNKCTRFARLPRVCCVSGKA
jgi:2,4-dienoyl-CoA reductase-like NADH-dependent reductase (Old Yellow Enzyme family)